MPQNFEISHAEKFPFELGRAPKKIQNAYIKTVIPILKTNPAQPNHPMIKKLNGYVNLWRIRISDNYRLVYSIDHQVRDVTLLMLDNRGKIYDRLGANLDGSPGARIIVNAESLIQREITSEEVGYATMEIANEIETSYRHNSDKELDVHFTKEKLASWNIPPEYYAVLKNIKTEGDLLTLSIPDEVMERILDGIWPRNIEEIYQQPVRINSNSEELLKSAEGQRKLESFLLKLDDEQKSFADRFLQNYPNGPWLLKGGPGSGKSTVALHCIRNLQQHKASQLSLDKEPIKILLTTYTNALVNASKYLLDMLPTQNESDVVDIINVDELARREKGNKRRKNLGKYIEVALTKLKTANRNFAFDISDKEFLEDEIEWVIFGQALNNVDSYLKADRSGRGRQLGQNQRRQIWDLHEKIKSKMHKENGVTFSELILEAYNKAIPRYDYVFIDEAQDLKPIAIRFCIKLCKNRNNVFLTADSNQSIYGSGMSWAKIASDLNFKGRARILKKNYRVTKEIWDAVTLLAPDAEGIDRETLDVEPVYSGEYPTLALYSDRQKTMLKIDAYLQQVLPSERVSVSGVAILCRTSKEMNFVKNNLDPKYNGLEMRSKTVDLNHPGVKIMTMHAAKGLQFPIVIVFGVEQGIVPTQPKLEIDSEVHYLNEKRLLFVACSRAMRRLLVFASKDRPSPFVQNWNTELWEIEDI